MTEPRFLPPEPGRAPDKSPGAFRTISEVADDLDLPQHVLRFWETRFAQVKPLKRGGGRRYYRPDDVDLLRGIRQLLYGQGYTIKGVQRILRQDGPRFVQAIGRGERTVAAPPPEVADEPDETASEPAPPAAAVDTPASRFAPASSHPAPPARAGLSPSDVRRLRAALDELLECERVLATVFAPDDGPPEQSR